MPSKAELRRKWNEAEKDTVILHMLQRSKIKPNGSPFVLKLETFLRMADIKYEEDFTQPMSTKGKSPWITFNGEDIADSQFCIEHLSEKLEKDLNKNLTKEEKAISRAFRAMVEEHFTWCFASHQFVFNQGKFLKDIFPPFPGVPAFAQGAVFKMVIKTITSQAKAQGTGRHTKEEVDKIGNGILQALSDYLGDKDFFFGNEPTELDCVVFSFLSTVIVTAEEDDMAFKKKVHEDLTNLKDHFERMKEKYWSDWDDKLYVDHKAIKKAEEAERKKKEAEEKKKKKEEEAEAKKKKKEEEEEKKKKENEEADKKKEEEKKEKEGEEGKEKEEEKKEEEDNKDKE